MALTIKQQQGVKIAVQRFRDGERYTVISGFAGSGKTFTVKHIIEALKNEPRCEELRVAYCAYTGKAAQVLANRGNRPALTAHKLLYQIYPLKNGSFKYRKKDFLEYDVIICDECSMLPKEMAELLISYPVYIIFTGDPEQLSPIHPEDDNHLLDSPHIFLDEIMRQALDSDIIKLSMLIRNGQSIEGFKGKDAIVLPRNQLNTGMLLWADQILCATNTARINLNAQVRKLKGYQKVIEEGEKIICLKNEWDTLSYENGEALTNGVIGYLHNCKKSKYYYYPKIKVPNDSLDILTGDFTSDTDEYYGELGIDLNCLLTGRESLTSKQEYAIRRTRSSTKNLNKIPYNFTYAYAATYWKYQGSQAPKVLVLEENFPRDEDLKRKALYTAVTRASDKVVLITKG